MNEKRVSWDGYFMSLAAAAATRATCDRRHVGCVLVLAKSVVSTGYNGSVRGLAHCDDEGHQMVDGHCVRTVHAEANAVAQAARRGAAVDGATAYVTACPCWTCFRLLANAGVLRIVCGSAYSKSDGDVADGARLAGVVLEYLAPAGDMGVRESLLHANDQPGCP